MDTKLTYRIDEAVEASGIGRTKLYQMISTGSLPAIKIGRRTLIRCADLQTFIESLPNHKSS